MVPILRRAGLPRANTRLRRRYLALSPYLRTHGLGLGTSLSFSLIWSPSAKSNTKTFFGLLRANLNVIETCKNTVLLQRFFSS